MFVQNYSGLRFAVAAGAMLALAACGGDGEEAPQAQTTPQATPQQQQLKTGDRQIRMAQCQTATQGKVHFRIGNAVLGVPAPSVADAIPTGIQPPLKKEVVQQELQARVNTGEGCPEKPLSTTLLMLKDDLGHPLLEGSVGLLQSPPGDVTASFAKLTKQLQEKPNRNCKALGSQLIGCVGTETRGDRQTPVMYVISTDTSLKMNSGGPLAARCVLGQDKVQGCNIVDHLAGNVTFDVTLNPGDYSSAGLRAAREAAIARIESFRL
jgi:hypothetical protein